MVSAKWVHTWKSDENGKVVKAKARLVARDFSQRPGVDYHETFAPTPATPCTRLMAAIACELQLDLFHFDVQQAFVQAELNEVVLMRMPDADASGLRSTVRESSSFESEPIRLGSSVTILA